MLEIPKVWSIQMIPVYAPPPDCPILSTHYLSSKVVVRKKFKINMKCVQQDSDNLRIITFMLLLNY